MEQGPYWYFRYHEGGKQKKLYLGKTDDPEGELARKRAASRGEGGYLVVLLSNRTRTEQARTEQARTEQAITGPRRREEIWLSQI